MLVAVGEFRFRLSWVPRTMSHTACRHAPGSVRHGDDAALQSRYGSGGHWGTPDKVPVGSCRWPKLGRVRQGSVRWVRVPLTCAWLSLAAARGLGWQWRRLFLRRHPMWVSE